MGSNPLVSVITPVHNTDSALFEACAQGILGQEHPDFEWIIVDDGSNAQTARMLDEVGQTDPRIHVTHIKNQGVSHARNIGISQARGSYVAFVDSDDVAMPRFLSNALLAIQVHEVDMVCGHSRTVGPGAAPVQQAGSSSPSCLVLSGDALDDFIRYTVIGFPVGALLDKAKGIPPYQLFPKLYRRSVVEHLRFNEDMAFSEDSLFCLDVAHAIRSVALADEIWLDYVVHPASTTDATQLIDVASRLSQFAHYAERANVYGIARYDLGLRFFRFIRSSLVPLSHAASLPKLTHAIRQVYESPFADLLDCIDFDRYVLPAQTRAFIDVLRKRQPLAAALWLKLRAIRHRHSR